MPHIAVKCYPRNLTKPQLDAFISDLEGVVQKHLKAGSEYISVSYDEIPADEWKAKVYDPVIKPNLDTLAKKPGYEM